MMAGTLGWIMEAPAATAYAVLPVGVETITPEGKHAHSDVKAQYHAIVTIPSVSDSITFTNVHLFSPRRVIVNPSQ